jgi:hypothetical protein
MSTRSDAKSYASAKSIFSSARSNLRAGFGTRRSIRRRGLTDQDLVLGEPCDQNPTEEASRFQWCASVRDSQEIIGSVSPYISEFVSKADYDCAWLEVFNFTPQYPELAL